MLPLQMLLAALLGWLEGEQRDVIACLREENRALKAQLTGRRLRIVALVCAWIERIASLRNHVSEEASVIPSSLPQNRPSGATPGDSGPMKKPSLLSPTRAMPIHAP